MMFDMKVQLFFTLTTTRIEEGGKNVVLPLWDNNLFKFFIVGTQIEIKNRKFTNVKVMNGINSILTLNNTFTSRVAFV